MESAEYFLVIHTETAKIQFFLAVVKQNMNCSQQFVFVLYPNIL